MNIKHKTLLTAATITAALTTLTACTPTQPATDITSYNQIIDVRTPQEWNQGHLQTATLITLESPNFTQQISTLDKTADYYIYCRSGNRAEQAIQKMKQEGFTGTLTNGGSVENASQQTGLPIIVE